MLKKQKAKRLSNTKNRLNKKANKKNNLLRVCVL